MIEKKGEMKAVLFIAALALLFSPAASNAALTNNNRGVEPSLTRCTCSSISLPSELDHSEAAITWPAGNPDSLLAFKTSWVNAGSFSSLSPDFIYFGGIFSPMGGFVIKPARIISPHTNPSYVWGGEPAQGEKQPDPIPSSIILFAPGLAGILVHRNWPQKSSLRRMKRAVLQLIHRASDFSNRGDLERRILLTTGFATYFQFVHFKLRTIQLNR
jgi:hypothetical protein